MCTMIAETAPIEASGKGPGSWFRMTAANVGYDHASDSRFEHALLLDFVDATSPGFERIAIEMSLDSGRALVERLRTVIAAAERSGAAERA